MRGVDFAVMFWVVMNNGDGHHTEAKLMPHFESVLKNQVPAGVSFPDEKPIGLKFDQGEIVLFKGLQVAADLAREDGRLSLACEHDCGDARKLGEATGLIEVAPVDDRLAALNAVGRGHFGDAEGALGVTGSGTRDNAEGLDTHG